MDRLVNFGRFIADTRREKGVSQFDMATGLKCTQANLSQIESGIISNPKESLMRSLADALGVSYDRVMQEFVVDKYKWNPPIVCECKNDLMAAIQVLNVAKTKLEELVEGAQE